MVHHRSITFWYGANTFSAKSRTKFSQTILSASLSFNFKWKRILIYLVSQEVGSSCWQPSPHLPCQPCRWSGWLWKLHPKPLQTDHEVKDHRQSSFFARIIWLSVTWMVEDSWSVSRLLSSKDNHFFCDADPSTTSFVRSALAFVIFSALGHKQMRLSGEDFDICICQAVNMKHWVRPNF